MNKSLFVVRGIVLGLVFALLGTAIVHADAPRAPSALVIAQCNFVVGLVLTDEHGGLHPIDISGLNLSQVTAITERAEHVAQATLPCKAEDKAV
jgi:hypothetical protein